MILSLDIGGTAIKLGLVDRAGNIHARSVENVILGDSRASVYTAILQATASFLRKHRPSLEGIAVSATGQVETGTGMIIGSNSGIPHYEGTNLKGWFEKILGLKTWVINDANAAVLGECFVGKAKGLKDVLMITIGTGIGGGVVSGGKLLEGKRGIAGELGHIPLYADGVACTCGGRGCFENYASTKALVRRCEQASGLSGLNGKLIFEGILRNEINLRSELNDWIMDITAGISGLIHTFNPEMVLIGGGVSAQEELLIRPLREEILKRVMPRFREGLRIEKALLGNDAGMVGAVRFWLDQQEAKVSL